MTTAPRATLTDATVAKTFLLAGQACVTFLSTATGNRFTYRITAKDVVPAGPVAPDATKTLFFVALLNGPENSSDYAYLGTIFEGATYRHGRKSRITPEAPAAKAFAWCWAHLAKGALPPGVEVWHEGRCGRCGHLLTVPESIALGLGPVCAGR